MKKAYVSISTKQAKAVITAHGGELPLTNNGHTTLNCGAILRRLPSICRKGKDKVHANAYRLTAEKPEILQSIMDTVWALGRSVTLRYETDPAELQAKLEAARLRNTTV